MKESIIIRELFDGKHKSVVEELSEESDVTKVTESSSEVGKPEREYPLERDNCTIERYTEWIDGSSHAEYKVFRVDFGGMKESERERVQKVFKRLGVLNYHKEYLDEAETYDQLKETADVVREYESIYNIARSMWRNDSIKPYATNVYEPCDFEINQFQQGFYQIPMLNHRHANKVIGEYLNENDLGNFSIVWGGFIVRPENFSKVHEVLKSFYKVPKVFKE